MFIISNDEMTSLIHICYFGFHFLLFKKIWNSVTWFYLAFFSDFQIGADGFNSGLRKAMNSQYISYDYAKMGVVATVEISEVNKTGTFRPVFQISINSSAITKKISFFIFLLKKCVFLTWFFLLLDIPL